MTKEPTDAEKENYFMHCVDLERKLEAARKQLLDKSQKAIIHNRDEVAFCLEVSRQYFCAVREHGTALGVLKQPEPGAMKPPTPKAYS